MAEQRQKLEDAQGWQAQLQDRLEQLQGEVATLEEAAEQVRAAAAPAADVPILLPPLLLLLARGLAMAHTGLRRIH